MFLTWRLFGSLPATYKSKRQMIQDQGRAFAEFDRLLDRAATGPKWLAYPAVAGCVLKTIRAGAESGMYELYSFVVMANHVHLLVKPLAPLAKITNWIKGVSAREANLILRRTGHHFWQQESYDHWVRSAQEFQKIRAYIERNPVRAALVSHPRLWKYSSAFGGTA
jgi:REP element-mobilizing transposase RayT